MNYCHCQVENWSWSQIWSWPPTPPQWAQVRWKWDQSQSGPCHNELRWDRDGTGARARVGPPQKHPTILHSVHSMRCSCIGNKALCLFSVGLKINYCQVEIWSWSQIWSWPPNTSTMISGETEMGLEPEPE